RKGSLVVVDDDGVVARGRDDGTLGSHQVDLRAAALDPGRAARERRRRLDALEPKQPVEGEARLQVSLVDLDAHMLKGHAPPAKRATSARSSSLSHGGSPAAA